MTTRELYNAVINTLDEYGTDSAIDLAVEMRGLVSKLDARNEKRKSAESKEKRETASRRETVLGLLSETPVFAESIANDSGLSVGQVRSALSTLVREGKASKTEVKDGKSRKMAYSLPTEA